MLRYRPPRPGSGEVGLVTRQVPVAGSAALNRALVFPILSGSNLTPEP